MKCCPSCGEPLEPPTADDVRKAEQEWLSAAGAPFTEAQREGREATIADLRSRFLRLRDYVLSENNL